jgi:hypothetical protein
MIEIFGVIGIALQHGAVFIGVVEIIACQVKSIMFDQYRNIDHDIEQVGYMTDPCIIDLMWTEMTIDFYPLARNNGEYGIGMLIGGLCA